MDLEFWNNRNLLYSNSLLRISKSYDGEPDPQDVYIKSKNLPPITQTIGYQISTRVIMPGTQNVNVDYLDISNSSSTLRYTFSACRSECVVFIEKIY